MFIISLVIAAIVLRIFYSIERNKSSTPFRDAMMKSKKMKQDKGKTGEK